ncbi:hypothetical protein CU665_21270 [Pseudomonas syringae pv. actinidifoliorum]|nr:hypothetical protein [Pseudomonas syringae pv. theae]NAS97011.1 hypothetical protein [Pseudomonas syringae pv. actinidifoliorum]MBL3835200.1 hypothetical protein [Pseudomonas syringae pv. theae]MBL3865395.1 hypothetical protein [Pseudomonas syringae pv. theae]MBL3875614.1 hypothetical protein [Pseudomonas syringae pv. theae]
MEADLDIETNTYFVGADRATLRLSAKGPVHLTEMSRLKYSLRGQAKRRPVLSHKSLPTERVRGVRNAAHSSQKINQ